ncbi:hypothetical protein IYZ83_000180 [Wolbachia pipientis]|uniref:hypothetical protein n=1 Tax=Wolbachia pipientis TaxID=955 RepID=UPI001BD9DD24|nr:hypothetical protein [Wolbachia pipientis]UIP91699.1 hypothetical protein IYZ83_000180 [Wolbachia pipientis]
MHGSISDEVVKNLDKLASYKERNKFNKTFNNLTTKHKNEYIRHVKAKPKGSLAMSGILNALDKQKALSIFKELLQKDKEFAFNTLDCIHPQYTLFKTLFNQLNTQQKEDYKVNLETKSTVKAKLVLKNFYLSNKESSSNLSTRPAAKGKLLFS